MFTSNTPIKAAPKIDIEFGNSFDRFLSIASGTENAIEVEDEIAAGASGVVIFHIPKHGLMSGANVILNPDGNIGKFQERDVDKAHIVQVIDANRFSITLTNNGDAPQGKAMIGGNHIPNISIQIAADVDKSYDLLDGDKLIVNGIPFTAKNEGNGFDGSAGQIRTNMNQSAEDLAIAVQEAIEWYIILKGDGYEKLEDIRVERDGAKLTFINNSADNDYESLYIKTEGNARITGGVDQYFSNVTLSADKNEADTSSAITNHSAANPSGGTLEIGDIVTNGSSDYLTVNMAGHGFKDGYILKFTQAIPLSEGGLTAAAGDYKVKVLDEDHFQISSPSITGSYNGIPGTNYNFSNEYTIDQPEQQYNHDTDEYGASGSGVHLLGINEE